jgi:hypothetical protein
MTRNSRKFQKQTKPQQNQQQNNRTPAPPQTNERPSDNPFGLSFVVPTEFVELPTKGEYYPSTSPLSNLEKVEIKHMTAKEEDLLSTTTQETGTLIFDRLIDSLLVDKTIKSEMFCEEDKTAVLMAARVSGYGAEYTVLEYCENCEDRTEHEYDLNKREVTHEQYHDLEYSSEQNLYKITLPKTGLKVEMINFSKEDEEAMSQEKKQKLKHKLGYNYTLSFLNRAVVTVDGVSDKQMLTKLFEVLPAADASVLKDVYNRAKPTISTMQEVACSVCGTSARKEVPLSWAFFRTDI